MSDEPISWLNECSYEVIELIANCIKFRGKEWEVPAETSFKVGAIIQNYCTVRDEPLRRKP